MVRDMNSTMHNCRLPGALMKTCKNGGRLLTAYQLIRGKFWLQFWTPNKVKRISWNYVTKNWKIPNVFGFLQWETTLSIGMSRARM